MPQTIDLRREVLPASQFSTSWRKVLGWVPVVLLLAGVANHYWLALHHQISPWLGAGFGMFASTDMPSARHVHVIAVLSDGSEREIALGESYQDALERARGLPSDNRMQYAAETAFSALRAAPEIGFPAAPHALRIEVWRTDYAPYTLKPVDSLIALGTWPFSPDEH